MLTAQEVYSASIQSLPLSERLRLAAIILEDLSRTAGPVLDFSDSWSEEDVRDLTTFASQHAATAYPEDRDLV